jgi:3-oxoacyl-[acyl-carrier protein] reductase
MSRLLEGKVAVVSGSGQGVGRAIALAFAAQGASVVTNNRRRGMTETGQLTPEQMASIDEKQRGAIQKRREEIGGDAETTAEAIRQAGGSAVPCFGDISIPSDAQELVETAVKTFGSVDIVANIAGAFGFGSVTQITEETWDRVNGVKPKGYFNVIHYAAPYMMEKKWGRIINCTSRAFLGDWILHPEYCAANAGVVGLTRAVAIELYPYNITCNAFEPFARTRASAELEAAAFDVRTDDRLIMPGTNVPHFDDTPLPECVAPFICYLAGDDSALISGSVFSLAGNTIGIFSEPDVKASITKFGSEYWTMEELRTAAPFGLFRGYKTIAHPDNRI